jgi:hypothetical protein
MVVYFSLRLSGFVLFFERSRIMFIRRAYFCVAAVLAVSLITQSGCMRGPKRIVAPSIDAASAGQEAITMFDTNKDGKISGAELDKVPSLKKSLADKVNSGITAEDIAARIRQWQDTKVGKIGSVSCQVLKNGKPLAGAEVKFVPEKFLGTSMPVCSGTTQPDGNASLTSPVEGEDDVPGVPPGIYRVEITKSGENIPAKYNTQTIFGEEIAPDVMRRPPMVYDLKY